jgi:hypothetical protein
MNFKLSCDSETLYVALENEGGVEVSWQRDEAYLKRQCTVEEVQKYIKKECWIIEENDEEHC